MPAIHFLLLPGVDAANFLGDLLRQFSLDEHTMIRKMHKKLLPRVIMFCSFAAMLLINIFAWNFSSISLMLIAAAVSLTIFCIKGAPDQKGGAKK